MAVGTWLSSIGTIAAVIVALYLARRTERVRLRIQVGLRVMIVGDGSPPEDHLSIEVTNLGERPVTINSVGWAIGKRKQRRFGFQTLSGHHSDQYPAELQHGKTARFMVSFRATPQWMTDFARGFVKDLSDGSLRTLAALVNTSVGQTIEVKPEKELLQKLKAMQK